MRANARLAHWLAVQAVLVASVAPGCASDETTEPQTGAGSGGTGASRGIAPNTGGSAGDSAAGSAGRAEAAGDSGVVGQSGSSGQGNTAANLSVDPENANPSDVKAISEEPGHPKAAGNDGDPGTRWCNIGDSSVYPGDEWWAIDLGANYTLTEISIVWEKGATDYRYAIEVSTSLPAWLDLEQGVVLGSGSTSTDGRWSQLVSERLTTTGGETNRASTAALTDTITLPAEAEGRFVRIRIISVGNGFWPCFNELTVYGY